MYTCDVQSVPSTKHGEIMQSKDALQKMANTLGGIPILGTISGTPTYEAGVRYGDILLEVNGKKTSSYQEYVDAKELRTDGMDLVIFRNGSEVKLSILFNKSEVDKLALLHELADMRII